MPTPEARAAFHEAQLIASQMREIQEQEQLLKETREEANDSALRDRLERELVELRHQWMRLASQYVEAAVTFGQQIEVPRCEALHLRKS